jgi:hypothetical protein
MLCRPSFDRWRSLEYRSNRSHFSSEVRMLQKIATVGVSSLWHYGVISRWFPWQWYNASLFSMGQYFLVHHVYHKPKYVLSTMEDDIKYNDQRRRHSGQILVRLWNCDTYVHLRIYFTLYCFWISIWILNICPPFHLFVDRGLPNIIQNLSLLATDNADPIRECRSDLCAMSIRVSSFIIGNKSILLLIKLSLPTTSLRLSYCSPFLRLNRRPLIFYIISQYLRIAMQRVGCIPWDVWTMIRQDCIILIGRSIDTTVASPTSRRHEGVCSHCPGYCKWGQIDTTIVQGCNNNWRSAQGKITICLFLVWPSTRRWWSRIGGRKRRSKNKLLLHDGDKQLLRRVWQWWGG